MADYSEMPFLVDPPADAGYGASPGVSYSATPYMTYAAAQSPAPGTPWSNAGLDNAGMTWNAFDPQLTQSSPQWPPHPPTPWPAASNVPTMVPAGFPAPVNPATPCGVDGWRRSVEDSGGYLPKPDEDGWPTSRSFTSRPLTPFSSHTSSPSSGSSISRSRSLRSVGDENSKRPPREWRADFSMYKSLGFSLGSLFPKTRSPSISGYIPDIMKAPKVTLHPYLRYNSSHPPMSYDLRRNPSTLRFRSLDRQLDPWDMTRFACEPPLGHMRLYHAQLPWYVDATSANPVGVTLQDLFTAIWTTMMRPISQSDWWNTEMNEHARERIGRAWAERCEDMEERRRGVRRVDFLVDRVILEGLTKGRDGMWEMKLRRL